MHKGPTKSLPAPAPSSLPICPPRARCPSDTTSEDVPHVLLSPRLDSDCPRGKRQTRGTRPRDGPAHETGMVPGRSAALVGAGARSPLAPGNLSPSLPLQTSLQPDGGLGCPGSSRERTRSMLSDSEELWDRLCGPGKACASIDPHTEHSLSRREGKGERDTKSLPMPPAEWASYTFPLLATCLICSPEQSWCGVCPHPH